MTNEDKQKIMQEVNDILIKNSCTLAPIIHINPIANLESRIQVSFDIVEVKSQLSDKDGKEFFDAKDIEKKSEIITK